MVEQVNEEVIRGFIAASNRYDLDSAFEHFDPAARIIPLERFGLDSGVASYRRFLDDYFATLPDVHFEVPRLLSAGDEVWLVFRITGTHEGIMHGIEPTHRPLDYRQAALYRLRGGLITELDVITDDHAVFRQLGRYPGSPRAHV
jgi:predicted ester cyclase